jgi:hypothetical protein
MTDRPPEEVRIKLRHGEWEVEIACLENKIKQVVETVLSSLDSINLINPVSIQNQFDELRREIESIKSRTPHEPISHSIINHTEQKTITKSGMTCRGLLENLWHEGYFVNEHSLGEVHEELSRKGFNYDRTAVSHSLTDLVRENLLTRVGTMRNYRYIQKKPFNTSGISPSNVNTTTTAQI